MATTAKRPRKGTAKAAATPRGRTARSRDSRQSVAKAARTARDKYYDQSNEICEHIWQLLLNDEVGTSPDKDDVSAVVAKLRTWYEAGGAISLDEAFGVAPPAGVGRIHHVLRFRPMEERRVAYLAPLVWLRIIGFTKQQACSAVWRLNLGAPWKKKYPLVNLAPFGEPRKSGDPGFAGDVEEESKGIAVVERFYSEHIADKRVKSGSDTKVNLNNEVAHAKQFQTIDEIKARLFPRLEAAGIRIPPKLK